MHIEVEKIFDKDGNMVIGDDKKTKVAPPKVNTDFGSDAGLFFNMFIDNDPLNEINGNPFTRKDNCNNFEVEHCNVNRGGYGIQGSVIEKRNIAMDSKPQGMLYSNCDNKTNKETGITVPNDIVDLYLGGFDDDLFDQEMKNVVPKVGYDVGRSREGSAAGRQVRGNNPLQNIRNNRNLQKK